MLLVRLIPLWNWYACEVWLDDLRTTPRILITCNKVYCKPFSFLILNYIFGTFLSLNDYASSEDDYALEISREETIIYGVAIKLRFCAPSRERST